MNIVLPLVTKIVLFSSVSCLGVGLDTDNVAFIDTQTKTAQKCIHDYDVNGSNELLLMTVRVL